MAGLCDYLHYYSVSMITLGLFMVLMDPFDFGKILQVSWILFFFFLSVWAHRLSVQCHLVSQTRQE